jgi:hypothetical protein
MMKRLLSAFLFVTIVASWQGGYAQQTSCAQNLRLARATYEQGRLHEVPTYVQSCIQNGSDQEKVEAYKLLCLAYIYLEEPAKADEAMLNLLRTDNYFEVKPGSDPAEFIALYRGFRNWPVYRIGAKIGVNATQPNVIRSVQVASGEGTASSELRYTVAFQVGASADLPTNFFTRQGRKPFTIHGDLLYQQKKFELTSTVDRGGFTNTLSATETQSWIALPICGQYIFWNKKFNPYISLGPSVDYLLNSKLRLSRLRANTTSVEEKTIDVDRQKVNVSVVISAGTKFQMGGGFLVLEVSYVHGLTAVNKEENIFHNTASSLDYTYSDSVYKLSSVSVSAAYLFNKFNPKKLSRK